MKKLLTIFIYVCLPFSMMFSQNSATSDTKNDTTFQQNNLNVTNAEVTSTKTGTTKLMQTPISISSFAGDHLEEIGADKLTDFIQNAPGLTAHSFDEGHNIFQIRGIASNVNGPTVGYYLDDLPLNLLNNPLLPEVNPFDLERVEVLRGPQGTLYGAGAAGGVIRVLTKDADPTGFSTKVNLSGGTVKDGSESYSGQAAINLPIVKDVFAIRLAGGYQQLGGFIDNSTLGLENVNELTQANFRGKALLNVNDQLTIKGMYWWQDSDIGAFSNGTEKFDHPTPFEEANENSFNVINGVLEYKFSKLTFYSSTSLMDHDDKYKDASTGFFTTDFESEQKIFNQEIRLNSENEGAFNWLIGAKYNNSSNQTKTDLGFSLPDGTIFITPFSNEELTAKQYAVFGEASLRFLDNKAELTAGVRYFKEDREHEDFLPSIIDVLALLGLEKKRSKSYNHISPSVNLSYTPTENSSIYVKATNGFRSGIIQSGGNLVSTISSGVEAPDFVKEESIWSYEMGVKTTLADNKISMEGAVYSTDWNDSQSLTSNFVEIGGQPAIVNLVENTDGGKILGFEWNFMYAPVKGLSLGLNGNINNAEYKEDLPGISGIRKGDQISYVPKTTYVVYLGYSLPIGDKLMGKFFANLQHNSERIEISNGVIYNGDAMTILNGRIGVEAKNWGIFLYGKNLLNEDGALFRNATTPIDRRVRPLSFGVNLQLSF